MKYTSVQTSAVILTGPQWNCRQIWLVKMRKTCHFMLNAWSINIVNNLMMIKLNTLKSTDCILACSYESRWHTNLCIGAKVYCLRKTSVPDKQISAKTSTTTSRGSQAHVMRRNTHVTFSHPARRENRAGASREG